MAGKPLASLLKSLETVPDPRRQCRNLLHPLVNVVLIAFCAKLSGMKDYEDFAEYARLRLPFFAKFLSMPDGPPSEDTFRRVFEAIRPEALHRCLHEWLGELRRSVLGVDSEAPALVAIDGKSLRRTFDRKAGLGVLHVVSAWATESGFSLAQVAVEEKSNEIPAIPRVLDLFELKGCVISIDAAGTQTEIAAKIVDGGGDYVLALKGNQPTLFEAVKSHLESEYEKPEAERNLESAHCEEKGHGRETTTATTVGPLPDDLADKERWKGIRSFAVVVRRSKNRTTGKLTEDVRYFVSSLAADKLLLTKAIRKHWGIENGLHWTLDVYFDEDQLRVRDRTAGENLALLNRLAVSVLRGDKKTKGSVKIKMLKACMDDDYLIGLLSTNSSD